MRTNTTRASMAALGLTLLCVACGGPSKHPAASQPAASQAQASEAKRYDLRGKVIAIDKPGKRVTVDHQAIPGFMEAMTMAYPVKDATALDGLSPGEEITATIVSSDGMYWLEDIAPAR